MSVSLLHRSTQAIAVPFRFVPEIIRRALGLTIFIKQDHKLNLTGKCQHSRQLPTDLDARLAFRRQLRAERNAAAQRGQSTRHINRMTACAGTTAALRGE